MALQIALAKEDTVYDMAFTEAYLRVENITIACSNRVNNYMYGNSNFRKRMIYIEYSIYATAEVSDKIHAAKDALLAGESAVNINLQPVKNGSASFEIPENWAGQGNFDFDFVYTQCYYYLKQVFPNAIDVLEN